MIYPVVKEVVPDPRTTRELVILSLILKPEAAERPVVIR